MNITTVDVLVIAATLLALALLMRRSGASFSHRYAKIRIPVEQNRHRTASEPAEEEFNPAAWMEWFLFGSLLLVIVMMLGNV